MLLRRRSHEHRAHHEPVLGTVLTLFVRSGRRGDGERAERLLLTELARLDAVFNGFRDDSELSRWRRAPGGAVSAELAELLGLALEWQERGGGAFNPAVGEATAAWQRAAADGVVPDDDELTRLADGLVRPRYAMDGGRAVPLGDCSALNFNALAKGLVVDKACERVVAAVPVHELVVNVGGDLRHVGTEGVIVAVEDPGRPYDNAEPLMRVRVAGAGSATSGSARRGVRIGGRWFSHVIDPRTARPVDAVTSATVIARDAATADVVATVLSVLDPADGLAFADAGGWAGCVVDAESVVHTNPPWDAAAVF